MKRCSPTAVALLSLIGVGTAGAAGQSQPDANPPIAELIQQLGDDQFAVRRRAEDELIRFGPEAYDQLKTAEESGDLEIAERARYILQRMRVEWVRPDDSTEVRRTLARYGDLTEVDKEKRISRLAELPDNEGFPALCRIARLEPLPRVARQAALAVLGSKRPDDGKLTVIDACRAELNSSQRAPVVWIQLWLHELADRRAALHDWNRAIESEAALLKAESSETDFNVVYALMKRRLELCNELALLDETTAALLRMVELLDANDNPEQLAANLAWAMRWIIQNKRWDVLDQVVNQRREQLEANRQLLYYVAAATSRAGRAEQGEKLSQQAFEIEPDEAAERVDVAGEIADLGFIEWAEREYQQALQSLPVVGSESLRARYEWAMWLHDREEYKRAADVLGEFFDSMEEDDAARKLLIQQLDGRQYLNSIAARRQLYLACHYAAKGEFDKQRKALLEAAKLYNDDPDILIAMYRSPGADEEYRKATLKRIQEMSQKHLALIEQYPDEPSLHNQWAWLIGNTEGDYAKAVEHSLRSLELSPNEASYLDTLGRCYYAAGDLANAVKSQRQAVELAPHYAIMRRQLAQFEKELAAKK